MRVWQDTMCAFQRHYTNPATRDPSQTIAELKLTMKQADSLIIDLDGLVP
jgi:hypothetical protein